HAPSHRGFKGTRYVLDAIKRLQTEDAIDFEFILVEKLSHQDAIEVYKRADLLVDQLLAGWYGALAVELMALGKPVICYLRQEDFRFLPPGMGEELPMIGATPNSIYTVLKDWLTAPRSELIRLGQRGRQFMERWHNPLSIANDLKQRYEAVLA